MKWVVFTRLQSVKQQLRSNDLSVSTVSSVLCVVLADLTWRTSVPQQHYLNICVNCADRELSSEPMIAATRYMHITNGLMKFLVTKSCQKRWKHS